jgi:uncharacterized membrane protein
MKQLQSIESVWVGGLLVSVVLAVLVNVLGDRPAFAFDPLTLIRWVHIVAGILWVGLLYYFNFVQMPAVSAALSDRDGPGPSGIAKYVLPRALRWFRWASLVTWGAGAWYLAATGRLVDAFTLGLAGGGDPEYGLVMGVGVWLGTILLLNVWLLIWPHQKRILGLTPISSEAELSHSKQTVAFVARVNAVLSLPMLLFMVAASHGARI